MFAPMRGGYPAHDIGSKHCDAAGAASTRKEDPALVAGQRIPVPVVEYEQLGARQPFEQPGVAAVAARRRSPALDTVVYRRTDSLNRNHRMSSVARPMHFTASPGGSSAPTTIRAGLRGGRLH